MKNNLLILNATVKVKTQQWTHPKAHNHLIKKTHSV